MFDFHASLICWVQNNLCSMRVKNKIWCIYIKSKTIFPIFTYFNYQKLMVQKYFVKLVKNLFQRYFISCLLLNLVSTCKALFIHGVMSVTIALFFLNFQHLLQNFAPFWSFLKIFCWQKKKFWMSRLVFK